MAEKGREPEDGLSIAERTTLTRGADFWSTEAVGGVPSLVLTDGPHGVRKQTGASDHLGLADSEPATCFPPAVGLAQSWDRDLVERVGVALGREARALGVDVLLGPGINIKRDPRGGRSFEYYSEDPLLSGVLGAAWVTGVQSVGVGTSLKHFALNNAETDRMRSSSDVDARPMREIYLRAFDHVVRVARPWTVMCSYNRINGVHAAENRWLLTELLRDEWGFDGLVVSDWGAVRDRVAAVRAGLDLTMPGDGGTGDAAVIAALESGVLDESSLDRAASAMATLADRTRAGHDEAITVDHDTHHRLAREVAGRCVVLLKNDRHVDEKPLLPLTPGTRIAVIGEFAQAPRYQGGGSSHVNATRVDIPIDEIRAFAGDGIVTSARGFTTDGSDDAAALRATAVAAAADADVAVLFLGLGERQESEGFDRTDIELPADQLELAAAVVDAQPRTVVVLSHGGVVRLAPIVDAVPAIVDGGLLGQAGGGALADVLFGVVNPSGRLAETVPVRLADCPSFLDFPGEHSHVRYGEGIFVGYRGFDARGLPVTFPFGHGLSYTDFAYSDLSVDVDDGGLRVAVTVTNTGAVTGREVVQVYTARTGSAVVRPPRELAAFAVTDDLVPDATQRVSVTVPRSQLAHWDVRIDAWVVEGGPRDVEVGASSRDIRLEASVEIAGDEVDLPLTWQSTLAEAIADPAVAEALASSMPEGAGDMAGSDLLTLVGSMPLDRLRNFGLASPALVDLLGDPDDV
ncbi:glycoside hydrolase family 3 C-terminal domain-containing protein [Williamsia deligens]|uniref:Glycoside hydrolase family 3 C-terminal domain-containing protein n=1 Tax=Williamsia deligens TaxID=321325 RepID=A0ABW3G4F2_9NOCA|nr:glycoside hydrolase family 3 C-terminal domain-containing protein [Williamsia deligens]MCP2194217.1 beta-glucosidase [Williamsia deligens]